jgi:predicted nucleotidyltransferase
VAEPTGARASGPSIAQLARMRAEILGTAARHGATNVRVFGSVARGDADAASDVDFLVDFEAGRSLLDLASLLVDLEDLLGRPVDVVTEPGLKARIHQRVLAEAVSV